MRQLYLILFSTLICLTGIAQTKITEKVLKQPLQLVRPDSNLLDDFYWERYRKEAIKIDTTLTAIHFALNKDDKRNYQKLKKEWDEEIYPNLNVVGGLTDLEKNANTDSVTEILRKALKLYLLTGNPQYYEVVDRALNNGIRGNLSMYNSYNTRHKAAQEAISLLGYIYAKDAKGFYINNFYNGACNIVWGENNLVKLSCLTSYPWRGFMRYKIKIEKGERHFKIRIRIPNWTQGKVNLSTVVSDKNNSRNKILINGTKIKLETENGYYVIDRTWKDDDWIVLDFDLMVHHLTDNANKGKVALQYGPLVYSLIKKDEINKVDPYQPFFLKFDLEHYKVKLINGHLVNEDKKKKKHPLLAPYYSIKHNHGDITPIWIKLQEEK